MPNNILDIRRYNFTNKDRLFFDTNVWFYIYGPVGNPIDSRSVSYSRALEEIITEDCNICIDALVVSEFINRFARLQHQLWMEENQDNIEFKEFRNSPAFEPIASDIKSSIDRILIDCKRIESGFSRIDINALIDTFGQGKRDFTDLMVVEICRLHNLTLITDDVDYRGAAIQILTSNRHLLA